VEFSSDPNANNLQATLSNCAIRLSKLCSLDIVVPAVSCAFGLTLHAIMLSV
jgi:hypothetical protein